MRAQRMGQIMQDTVYSSIVLMDDEFDVEIDIELTELGYSATYDDPGAGAEFDVLEVRLMIGDDYHVVTGAQERLMLNRAEHTLCERANSMSDEVRWHRRAYGYRYGY